MKKRVIIGVLLIIIAIGGTIAMNTAGIFKGTPYKAIDGNEHFSYISYTFYDNTYKKEYKYRSDNTKTYVDNGFYSLIDGEFRNGSGGGTRDKINAYRLISSDNIKYINKTAIWLQIGFGAVLIIGIIEIVVAGITKKKKS